MTPTTVAAVSVAGAFLLMLGALAYAIPRTVQPLQYVTVTRINGHKVTQEVGIVKSWSLSGGHMTLEYVTDTVFSDNFDAPR